MDAIAAATGLDPALIGQVLAAVAGVALYLLQRFWTGCPLLPWLGADDSARKKRIVAILLAAGAAWLGGQGDWQKAAVLFLGTFTASQATFTLTKAPEADK